MVAGKPINSGYHMANSTMVGVLGQIACYTGRPTEWKAAKNSDLEFAPSPEQSNFEIAPPTRMDETGNFPLPMPGITKFL